MPVKILDKVQFRLDLKEFFQATRIRPDSQDGDRGRALAKEAEGIARPKAVFREVLIVDRGQSFITLDSIKINSQILRVNSQGLDRVFAYVASCGMELFNWAQGHFDMLDRYLADSIMERALNSALKGLEDYLRDNFNADRLSYINPGSLEDWPIEGQADLFGLLGDVEGAIGVRLTESYLMLPFKSSSGILFSAEKDYSSCMLCDRPTCPNRRAAYDSKLYETKYRDS